MSGPTEQPSGYTCLSPWAMLARLAMPSRAQALATPSHIRRPASRRPARRKRERP